MDQHFQKTIEAMAQRNIGALTAITELIKVDQGAAALALGILAAYEIRGPMLWLVYKDICGENAQLMLRRLRTKDGESIARDLEDLEYSGYKRPVMPNDAHA